VCTPRLPDPCPSWSLPSPWDLPCLILRYHSSPVLDAAMQTIHNKWRLQHHCCQNHTFRKHHILHASCHHSQNNGILYSRSCFASRILFFNTLRLYTFSVFLSMLECEKLFRKLTAIFSILHNLSL